MARIKSVKVVSIERVFDAVERDEAGTEWAVAFDDEGNELGREELQYED